MPEKILGRGGHPFSAMFVAVMSVYGLFKDGVVYRLRR